MMKHHFRVTLALAACMAALCGPAKADGLVIITNSALTLSADDVRDVFLGDKQMSGTTKLVPIDNASAQDAFLASVVKLEASKYTTVWTKKSFRDGLNPPSVKASDSEVIEFVKHTPGAVGYVKKAPASGVNVVK